MVATGLGDPDPFEVAVPDAVLADLRARLRATRWPQPFREPEWEAGMPLTYLPDVCNYWAETFDWRRHEERINSRPHFKVTIDGATVHFMHVRGRGPDPLPLVLTHGWPSSFFEFDKLIDLLIDPEAAGGDPGDAFDLVIPALPGYPFSEPLTEAGALGRIPQLWHRLVHGVLGYRRYGAHGGDLGALVTAALGREHPESVVGIHILALLAAVDRDDPSLSAAEREFLSERDAWAQSEGGYSHIQQTRPQTLAYGLSDSPAGLAAWLIEKYLRWSDGTWGTDRGIPLDELLVTPTMYWAANAIGPSFMPYFDAGDVVAPQRWGRVEVPTAAALFPADLPVPPREYGERAYDIQRWTVMPRGGHFAAAEQPELLAADLREFFRQLR